MVPPGRPGFDPQTSRIPTLTRHIIFVAIWVLGGSLDDDVIASALMHFLSGENKYMSGLGLTNHYNKITRYDTV